MAEQTRYQVRLSVPRVGGWRAWGAVSGEFERRLAEQDSPAITARVDSWVRRGRDYLQVVIVATVDTGDVAEALDMAWWVFRKATGDDAEGWDMAGRETSREPSSLPACKTIQSSAASGSTSPPGPLKEPRQPPTRSARQSELN